MEPGRPKVTAAITGPDIFHKKYTGQDDDGTGLLFYNVRYYDPAIGRFISADRLVPNPYNTQSFNRYMYVLGNPVRYNDPSGLYENDGPSAPDHGDSQGPGSAPEGNHQPGPGSHGDHGGSTGLGRLLNYAYSALFGPITSKNMYASMELNWLKYINKTKPVGNWDDGQCIDAAFNFGSRLLSKIVGWAKEFKSKSGSSGSIPGGFASQGLAGRGSGSSSKGYFDRFVDGVQKWGQDVTRGPSAFGAYLGNHRVAGFAACVGGAVFGVAYTFATEYVVAAKAFEALDLTTGVLNGVIPDSPPPLLNSLPLAVGWALANFREPIGAYVSDIWNELKKVRMELDR